VNLRFFKENADAHRLAVAAARGGKVNETNRGGARAATRRRALGANAERGRPVRVKGVRRDISQIFADHF
jgi:hypothetical protein